MAEPMNDTNTELLAALAQRVQELEDMVEELIEISLVNRSALLVAMKKQTITREELRAIYERVELAHEDAREQGGQYRILPAAGAYFLESE